MPLHNLIDIRPNENTPFDSHHSIRKKWIQNLINCLDFCLLKGDLVRAKRAWSILIRCREVNWKTRWYWGLLILSSSSSIEHNHFDRPTQRSTYVDDTQRGRDIERWLNALRVSAREEDKPSLLHALVLHLIKSGQYRHAYDQLETYLSSYPFLLSGPLHTYAGLLAFYLAQPLSLRAESGSFTSTHHGRQRTPEDGSSSSPPRGITHQPADSAGLRQARGWFVKALEIDKNDEIAKNFIELIDNPYEKENSDDESDMQDDEKSDESMKEFTELDSEISEAEDDKGDEVEVSEDERGDEKEETVSEKGDDSRGEEEESRSGRSW